LALMRQPGAQERFVARFRRHDGTYRSLDVTINNRLEDPEIAGLVANARDITEQVDATDALIQNEQRWAALVRNSYDIIAILDDIGTLQYSSLAAERMLGYPPEQLIGTNAFDLVHPDDLELAAGTFARVLNQPEMPVRIELRIRHANGTWRDIEIAASNFLDDPAVRGIVLNNRDVTDRRRAEDANRASEEWFRSLVQHGHDIIAVIDAASSKVRYVSPSIRHLMALEPEEVMAAEGSAFIHPDDQRTLAAHFARVIAAPGVHTPIEVRARHGDGTWRWLEVACTNQVDNPVVQGVVLNLRDVTERKEVEGQLSHQALHDSLTGLPNRGLVTDRLTHALARAARVDTRLGVLFLDVDRFKLVNDTRGHDVGDQLLIAAADRLRLATRESDTVARFGGDEFVVVYEDANDVEELLRFAERLCSVVAIPFQVDGTELYATISVGVAIGGAGASADALLRDADAAMYHAKERGGGAVAAFDESIRHRARSRFDMERELRGGLERDEFALEYQPIVALSDGRIVGVEALVRWDHPERGTVPPGEFVELAEETGLIIPIERRIRGIACRQLAEWRATPQLADLSLSLNVSATQLRDAAGFAERVEATLAETGLPASALTLEITESFLMEDTAACLDGLAALKALGIRLVVDDFGTRYSSLGYLNRMSLDGLKIDRSFVSGIGPDELDRAIVAAIITMAKSLGLWVVAEGVETAEQSAVLTKLGCEYAQGFYFSRPLRPEAATVLLAAH